MSAFLEPPPLARAFGRALQDAILRAEQARAIRETRALYPNDIRAWRNGSARFAAQVVRNRAQEAARSPRAVDLRPAKQPCGRHTVHDVCTCYT